MIVKFRETNEINDNILEVEKEGDKVTFFIYPLNEEQIGRSITLGQKDIADLIQYLKTFPMYQ